MTERYYKGCGTELSPFFPPHKGWSSVFYTKGNLKRNLGAPFLSIWRIQTALIMATAEILLGHFTEEGSESKTDHSIGPHFRHE